MGVGVEPNQRPQESLAPYKSCNTVLSDGTDTFQCTKFGIQKRRHDTVPEMTHNMRHVEV